MEKRELKAVPRLVYDDITKSYIVNHALVWKDPSESELGKSNE